MVVSIDEIYNSQRFHVICGKSAIAYKLFSEIILLNHWDLSILPLGNSMSLFTFIQAYILCVTLGYDFDFLLTTKCFIYNTGLEVYYLYVVG